MRTAFVLVALAAAVVAGLLSYVRSRGGSDAVADALAINSLVYQRAFDTAHETRTPVADFTNHSVAEFLDAATNVAAVGSREQAAVARVRARSADFAIISGHLVPKQYAAGVLGGLSQNGARR